MPHRFYAILTYVNAPFMAIYGKPYFLETRSTSEWFFVNHLFWSFFLGV